MEANRQAWKPKHTYPSVVREPESSMPVGRAEVYPLSVGEEQISWPIFPVVKPSETDKSVPPRILVNEDDLEYGEDKKSTEVKSIEFTSESTKNS